MSDESTTALREIAELLAKRVEQEDAVAARALESSKRGAEMTARMRGVTEEAKARSEEMRRKMEEMRYRSRPRIARNLERKWKAVARKNGSSGRVFSQNWSDTIPCSAKSSKDYESPR